MRQWKQRQVIVVCRVLNERIKAFSDLNEYNSSGAWSRRKEHDLQQLKKKKKTIDSTVDIISNFLRGCCGHWRFRHLRSFPHQFTALFCVLVWRHQSISNITEKEKKTPEAFRYGTGNRNKIVLSIFFSPTAFILQCLSLWSELW